MESEIVKEEFEVTSLLEQCKTEIARLESLLHEQRHIQSHLEKRLLAIRHRGSLFSLLPPEILQQIFEDAVDNNISTEGPTDARLKAIASLAMVSRQWNQIISNCPTIWSRIEVGLVFDADVVRQDTRYLDTAIRKSSTLPLDIDLRFPGFNDICRMIAARLLATKNPDNPKNHALRQDYLSGMIMPVFEDLDMQDGVFIVENESDTHFVPYGMVLEAMEEFMETLSGPDGLNLLRLRSLSIVWRDGYFQELLRQGYFHFPTPMLRELRLRTEHWQRRVSLQPFIHNAPNLVRHSTDPWFDNCMVQSNQLLELDFTLWETEKKSILLRSANNLQRLHLNILSNIDIPQTEFPRLLQLNLWSNVFGGGGVINAIESPNLEVLRFLYNDPNSLFDLTLRTPRLRQLCLWAPPLYNEETARIISDGVKKLRLMEKVWFLHMPGQTTLEAYRNHLLLNNRGISVRTFKVTDKHLSRVHWKERVALLD